jgi:GNAT superfamily N-acetyltransferase
MKYKIEDTVDKTGEPVSIWHSDCFVQNKELYTIYEKSIAFMMEKGWAMNPSGLIKSDHKVIFAENKDGRPMGGVVYEYHPWNRQGWIVLIFTADEFRGRHIYSLLQKALEDETIKLGGTSIASLAHKDNEPRIKAGAREGMHPQYLRLYKDLSNELEKRKTYMQIKLKKEWKDITKERWRG